MILSGWEEIMQQVICIHGPAEGILPERKKLLNDSLLMFFTGFTRFSSEVQKVNTQSYAEKTAQLKQMLALVDQAHRELK